MGHPPALQKPPSYILLFIFFYLPDLKERKECCSCLKWPRCSLATLTHLNRWKSISVAFEAGDTVAQQHELSTADVGMSFWENVAQKKRNKCCHRALVWVWEESGPLLRSAGHSQRAPAELLINECAMKTETQLSTIQYFPSPPVMCIESHRSISYMQSSTELKGLQVHFNYSASLQDYELLS